MTTEKKETTAMTKVLGSPKDDAVVAGYLAEARQIIKTIKAPLAAKLAEADSVYGTKEQLVTFFDTKLGDLVLFYVVAAGLEMLPIGLAQDHRDHLAVSMRVKGLEGVMEMAMDLIGDPLREALAEAVTK